jgi:DNA-binding MarR family transcriptional regulator
MAAVSRTPDQPDPVIHQTVRLKIMAALKALPDTDQDSGRLEFVRLRELVGATEGNLGAHITSLETAGYIEVTKDFQGRKPRTRVRLTRTGRNALADYVAFMRSIIDG